MAKYAVLVTHTHVCCDSVVIDAADEDAAREAAVVELKRRVDLNDFEMKEVESRFDAEVLRQIVGAGPPPQDPHAKKTVAIKKIVVPDECTCTAGRHAGCPVPGHDDGDR